MAKIKPFMALRPKKALASQVATLPYDVCSVKEAKVYRQDPHNFYHVTRAEIDLPDDIDVHDKVVYAQASVNLNRMIEKGILKQDKEDYYYLYQLVFKGRSQTGLLCASSVDDYNNGVIKKHEYTRPEKELDRINHIKTTKAQTGVVFLAYKNVASLNSIIEKWKQKKDPEYDFKSEDGVEHTLWVVKDRETIDEITNIFENDVPATYIADGHHRAASAAKVANHFSSNAGQSDSHNYFLTCIFPDNQLEIMDYNRVVKDLNGLSTERFLELLSIDFDVELIGRKAVKPSKTHEFGMFLNKEWYKLSVKPGTFKDDPIGILDVSILQNNVLSKILNINDPRTDKRVEFVGGIRGLSELEKRVKSGEMAAAFSCYPVSMEQLFEVADSGQVMPPKSTWFEPKTRDGLVTYMISSEL